MDSFKITESHLKLLKRMYVSAGDGAPEINPKRPYGNSDVVDDILGILGFPKPENPDGWDEYPEALQDYALQIHRDTEKVLQICLATQSFVEGTYQKEDTYDARSWKKVKQ